MLLTHSGITFTSPCVLFALFLNDLESFLSENNCSGINLKMSNDDLSTYIKDICIALR